LKKINIPKLRLNVISVTLDLLSPDQRYDIWKIPCCICNCPILSHQRFVTPISPIARMISDPLSTSIVFMVTNCPPIFRHKCPSLSRHRFGVNSGVLRFLSESVKALMKNSNYKWIFYYWIFFEQWILVYKSCKSERRSPEIWQNWAFGEITKIRLPSLCMNWGDHGR
jgi:hypothetical protein